MGERRSGCIGCLCASSLALAEGERAGERVPCPPGLRAREGQLASRLERDSVNVHDLSLAERA